MASQIFEVLIPAPSNNPYGGVLEANRAGPLLLVIALLYFVLLMRDKCYLIISDGELTVH
ncbi:hypothetical protein [Coxiella-like endosymbiont of Rhipicephalus sanguineus]|uniref:hypothetical protein n=1 Tax=Coxiella-like endosymbiont of Rhipicephalus sanguineus TaxID=1955402 RepID=UPI00203AD9D5|nr:hypothetical protein [Coxiella-like endosymbiont of Rhipicephalus sanguineus]